MADYDFERVYLRNINVGDYVDKSDYNVVTQDDIVLFKKVKKIIISHLPLFCCIPCCCFGMYVIIYLEDDTSIRGRAHNTAYRRI